MTLYLKYRSQTLDELDLENVRETLKKIVASKNIPHAFLFAGPKGTGKTSSARILAKIINCTKENKPCNECDQCVSINRGSNLDVVELDAASHRGIDDVRALRDAVKLSPVKANKKIYIIDEAHMLTTEASNALLKTLEEPPDHVVFILATTNPEKLIETIRSRTTLVNFKKASKDEVIRSLERIAKGEKVEVKKEVLEMVADISGGSFRDAVKTFEQLILEKKLAKSDAEEFLFKINSFESINFIEALASGKPKEALEVVEKVTNSGSSALNVIDQTLLILRNEILASAGVGERKVKNLGDEQAIHLIELLTTARGDLGNSPVEELPLEIAIIKFCKGEHMGRIKPEVEEMEKPIAKIDLKKKDEKKIEVIQTATKGELKELTDDIWKKILVQIKPINASVEALLRSSQPLSFDGTVLRLGVFYKFHKERLEEVHHRKILEDVLIEVLGKNSIRVSCVLTDPPKKQVVEEQKETGVLTEGKDDDIINVAEKIFGS